jgi:hypothetical protein
MLAKIHKQTRIKNYLYIFFSGFMPIGIPTVRRQQSSYFLKTLDSLLNCTSKKQFSGIVIVIFLADFNITVLHSSAVDREFEPQSGQTKDYKIGICCFSAKHTELRRKSEDWLTLVLIIKP